MSLFDSASLVVTPNGVKEDKLYSIKPSDGSGDLVVTRATTATRVNSVGLIEQVPYNLLTYSEQFDNGAWTKTAMSISANSTTAPNGTTTADTLSNTSSSAIILQGSASVSTSSIVTFSVYLKKTNNDWVSIAIARNGATTYGEIYVWFNLATGVVGSNLIDGAGVLVGANIENVGNDWYRCFVTGYVPNAISYTTFMFYPDANSSFNRVSGQSAYAWGAQLVTGSSAKEYFPTTDRLDVPRLDYTNSSCPSILVEPQRTNLALYSEQFDNAYWTKTNCTIGTNAVTSPSGLTNADNIITTSANSDMGVLIATVTANTSVYTQSGYFKWVSGYEIVKFRIALAGGTGQGAELIFNSRTGAFVSSNTTYKIESVGNGWFRVSLQITNNGTNTLLITQIYPTNETTQTQTISIWGVQMEVGSYATSYIPTIASTVTRNADVISKTGISSLIGQTEGTLFVDAYVTIKNEDLNPVVGLITINNNVNNLDNCIIVGIDRPTSGVNNRIYTIVQLSGTTVAEIFTPTITNGRYKIAFAYKQNDFVLYVNGVQIGTDTSGNVPTCNQVLLGERYNSDPYKLADNINSAIIWKTRLSNTELANLTTI